MSSSAENKITFILIVDDNQDDQLFLTRAIRKVLPDAKLKALSDGSDAIKFLFEGDEKPDLVFLDLQMEKLSGSFALSLIRKHHLIGKIPVVILTSSTGLHDRLNLKIKYKASEFFTKPVEQDDLVKIVEQIKIKYLQ